MDPGALAARVLARAPGDGARMLVALAGPPASGKTTLAAALAARLTAAGLPAAAVPMDGFHLDDAVLSARGLLPRKGAPETFDAAGLIHAMARLKAEPEVVLPAFDRARELALAGRLVVGPEVCCAVVEGNWLLHREPPWDRLAPLWDLSAWLDVPDDVLRARLMDRWAALGPAEARRRVEANDMPNAARARARRRPADLTWPPAP